MKTICDEFDEKSNSKILFVLAENLLGSRFNLLDSKIFFRGREGKLDELL